MSLALDSEYGLSVGVFTRDMDRALRFAEAIPAGIVNINDSSTYWEIHLPFGGGSGTRSGVGRLGGRLTLEAMTEIKMITVHAQYKEPGMTTVSELETTPEVGDEKLGPAGAAKLIAEFVDVLIPGERLWPSASAVGVQGQLALRLIEERGKNALPTLVKAIEAAGGPLAGLDEDARVAVVQRFEEAEPDLFGWVRDAAYIAYCRTPSSPRRSSSQVTLTSCARTSKAIQCSALISRATRRAIGGGATRRQRTCAGSTSAVSTSRATEPKPGA